MKNKVVLSNKTYQKTTFIVLSIIILFVGLFIYYASNYSTANSDLLPQSLVNSKEKLSSISKSINDLNQELAQKIIDIQNADKSNNPKLALSLIDQAQNINAQMKSQNNELKSNLQILQSSLNNLNNPPVMQMVADAIQSKKLLIEEFGNYTNLMDNFLTSLKTAISSPTSQNKQNVNNIIQAINNKINTINNLNKNFNATYNQIQTTLQTTK